MEQNLNRTADLHIHSVYSDSDATIEDIFREAKERKISCLALTDHDTVEGVLTAGEFSRIYDVELIPGIELSAQKDNNEVHILGYYLDLNSSFLKETLSEICLLRRDRFSLMVDKLKKQGVLINKEEILEEVAQMVPTRLHLALHLVKKNFTPNLVEAFKRYLSPGKPAYIANFKFSVKEAIAFIQKVGGVSVLAHPHLFPDKSWIEEFVKDGVYGIEVMYPRFSPQKTEYYSKLADKYKLLKTGGSDAHGSYKQYTHLGAVTIPYEWVEEMKKVRDKR